MLHYIIGISAISLVLILTGKLLGKRLSSRLKYALWLIIPLYMLICPFVEIGIELPARNEPAEITGITEDDKNDLYAADPLSTVPAVIPEGNISTDVAVRPLDNNVKSDESASAKPNIKILFRRISPIVSLALLGMVSVYNILFVLYLRKHRMFLRKDPASGLEIYYTDLPNAPFLLLNRIYLNGKDPDDEISRYAICHEYCHYRHKDNFWCALRLIVLAVNWYNPIIWYVYLLSGRDCELACDEAVIKKVGQENSIEYGKALLSVLAKGSGLSPVLSLSTSMSGRNKRFMKERINNIKTQKQFHILPIVLSLILVILAAGCALTKAEETTDISDNSESASEINTSETEQNPSEELIQISGWYVETENGQHLIVPYNNSGNSIIVMTAAQDTSIKWSIYQTGYSITISCEPLEETFPAQTKVHTIELIEEGTYENIPEDIWNSLIASSWVEASATLTVAPQIWTIPEAGELADGQYTVIMTPLVLDEEGSGETVVFIPWTQVEVDQEYIDNLKIGDIIELPDGEGSVTVTDLIEKDIGESILYGTTYTGKILIIDAVDYWTFEQTESGTWKLFSISDTPVYSSADPMRLPISPDLRIFDAYHPGLHGWDEDMTNEEITAFVEFRDTSLSEGYVNSIEEFFMSESGYIYQYEGYLTMPDYKWTIITVEDNTITEVYFCYHP